MDRQTTIMAMRYGGYGLEIAALALLYLGLDNEALAAIPRVLLYFAVGLGVCLIFASAIIRMLPERQRDTDATSRR